jgi:hypothetical protein
VIYLIHNKNIKNKVYLLSVLVGRFFYFIEQNIESYLCFRQGYGSFFRKGGFLFVTLLERLEAFEHNQTEAWYKDIYILNKGKYAKAPVVNVDGEKAVKMYGNVYVTKYDETRKAWLVNTKYGLYRF